MLCFQKTHFGKLKNSQKQALHKKPGSMTANEISKETGVPYITVQKYLSLLKKRSSFFK